MLYQYLLAILFILRLVKRSPQFAHKQFNFTSYWLWHVPGYHNILGDFLSFVVTCVSQFEANPLFNLKLCP